MHILTKKLPVTIESVDNYFILYNPNFKLKTLQKPEDDTVFLDFLISSIKTSEIENESIKNIFNKIDKYQQNKMSEKEVAKMLNKLKEEVIFADICRKMTNKEKLNEEDLKILANNQNQKIYVIDYNNINLEDNFIILDINYEKLLPQEEIQDELKKFYNKEQEEKQKNQKDKIASILGQEPSPKKTVLEYLKEKKEQIANNAANIYQLDPVYPLPQANDMERILEWGQSIANSGMESIELAVLENDAQSRDVHYYSRALCFLGLVFIDDKSLCLTHSGEVFFQQNLQSKKMILIDLLSQDKFIESYLQNTLTDDQILDQAKALGYSESTMKRRLSSMNSWKKFLLS